MTVGNSPDLFAPLLAQPSLMPMSNLLHDTANSSTNWLTVVGRLKPGVADDQARADLAVSAARYGITRVSPADRNKPLPLAVEFEPGSRGLSRLRDRFSEPLLVVWGLVGIVLLIACANLANLLLARTAARRKEISVRLAIGAPRARIVRQLVTESLLLAVIGGAAGLAFAIWSSGLLVRMLPATQVPIAVALTPDPRLLAFTLGLSTLTALLFGVAPALRETRVDANPALRQVRIRRFDLSRALVVAQIALAAPLIVGAGLFIGTLRNLIGQEAGFERRNVIQVQIAADAAGIPRPQWPAIYNQVIDRVKAVPGVRAASLTNRGLMEEGRTQSGPARRPRLHLQRRRASQPSRDLCRRRVLHRLRHPAPPRPLLHSRRRGGRRVRRHRQRHHGPTLLSRPNPIGLRYSLGSNPPSWTEIVGVVADAKYSDLRERDVPMAYYPWRQVGTPGLNSIIVRASGDTAQLGQRAPAGRPLGPSRPLPPGPHPLLANRRVAGARTDPRRPFRIPRPARSPGRLRRTLRRPLLRRHPPDRRDRRARRPRRPAVVGRLDGPS